MAAVINEQIKVLIELQKIDAQIYQLKKELGTHPALEKKHQEEFEKKKGQFKTAEDQLKGFQVKQKEKEVDLLSREEKIKKLQGQLYQLKSNKEYSAMELEIKGFKADKSLLEEDILRLLDSVDQAKTMAVKEKELLALEEKKLKDTLDILKKRAAEINAQVQEQDDKRKGYLPTVESRLLNQYERILKSREGLALVPVKNNSCGGCHLELPPQTLNEIQLQDKLIVCESCARILYWPA